MSPVLILILFSILCILVGVFLIVYPEKYFKSEFLFRVKDGTPTEYYITRTRLCGTILVLVAILALFILLIYNINWYAIL